MTVTIYLEGGGDSSALRTKCREGIRKFLEGAGLSGKIPKTVACGGRDDAYGRFCTALRAAGTDEFPLLLVDSEGPVTSPPWTHLASRDKWQKPDGATDDHAHLFVQCMESWFLADRQCLEQFFGQGFSANALSGNPDVEQIAKKDVEDRLKAATRHAKSKGVYHKGKHSFDLLGRVDPSKVTAASPHAKRFVETVTDKTTA